MKKQKIHPKIMSNIINWMLMPKKKLSYFGHFLSKMIIYQDNKTKTMYVTPYKNSFALGYNKKYVEKSSNAEIRYVLLHEIFHCFDLHLNRIKNRDLKTCNFAMDMIVNNQVDNLMALVNEDIQQPKKVIKIPPEYNDYIVFESIYTWLINNKKNKNEFKNSITNKLFERLENNDIFDNHYNNSNDDEIEPEQIKYNLIKMHNSIKNEMVGTVPNDIEKKIQHIKKRKENPVQLLKNAMSETARTSKKRTFKRFNRKNIDGFKGIKKDGITFNCIADVSGSMINILKEAIGIVTNSTYSMNLIKVDAKVQSHEFYEKSSDLKKLEFIGAGGTILQPGVDYIVKNKTLKKNGTIIITDGFIHSLDLSKLNNVIVVYTSKKPLIKNKSKKYKEIKINV